MVALFAMVMGVEAKPTVKSPHPSLKVEVARCAKASELVVVDLIITNKSKKEIHTDIKTNLISAYDNKGNSYTSKSANFKWGLINEGLDSANFLLPRNVPLKFRLQINGIESDVSKLKLVRLPIFQNSNNPLEIGAENPIEIRNVEWLE